MIPIAKSIAFALVLASIVTLAIASWVRGPIAPWWH